MFSSLVARESTGSYLQVRVADAQDEVALGFETVFFVRQFNIHGVNAVLESVENRFGVQSTEMLSFLRLLGPTLSRKLSTDSYEVRLYRIKYRNLYSPDFGREIISEELLLVADDVQK
jgi:hypothetical protein